MRVNSIPIVRKPFHSSTFDTVTVRILAENIDLRRHSQLNPDRMAYRKGRYVVRSRFGSDAALTSHRGRGLLFIEASLPKFLTGQNFIGTEKLLERTIELVDQVLKRARIELEPHEVRRYRSGNFTFTRVDYANHLWCGSHEQSVVFRNALHRRSMAKTWACAEHHAHTLHWSEHSKRRTLKAYLKYPEMQARTMSPLVRWRTKLLKLSRGLVRFELTLRGPELKRLAPEGVPLDRPGAWSPRIARELLTKHVTAVLPTKGQSIDITGMENLKRATRMRLQLWMLGHTSAFDEVPRARRDDRREILMHTGIDIDSVLPLPQQQKYAKPLLQMFEAGWDFKAWDSKWEKMKRGAPRLA